LMLENRNFRIVYESDDRPIERLTDMRWPKMVPRRLRAALPDDAVNLVRRAYAVHALSAWRQADAERTGEPASNFWDSLALSERQAFTAVAEERTFARGARLMREGEQANFVMLILAGWTQIIVQDGDRERVVAERGPGQLVGERGALRVNVRSATVVALETIRALVMRTEDFASFVSAHPRVLDVVESQIYGRLIEDPAGAEPTAWAGRRPTEPSGRPSVERPRQLQLAGENCTVLFTDVVGFGARNRNDRDRRIIRRGSLEMMQASFGALWDACIAEDRGDGLLIVVPPDIPTAKIMNCLHRGLPGGLALHNRTYGEHAHIRLRVAVNVGPVMGDPLGMSGEAIIRTARLIEAPAFKMAMASTGARLGIIASVFVYETAIRHADDAADSDAYTPIDVNVKESSTTAWMRLVDLAPARSGGPRPQPASGGRRPAVSPRPGGGRYRGPSPRGTLPT
jgi:hypothetical protein